MLKIRPYTSVSISIGWLPVLHNWLHSKDMVLCLHAARALVNVDSDSGCVGMSGPSMKTDVYNVMLFLFLQVGCLSYITGYVLRTWRCVYMLPEP